MLGRKLLLAAALVAAVINPVLAQDACPCGFAGVGCTDLAAEVVTPTDNVTCGIEAQECVVVKGVAKCRCSCGWTGDSCDEKVEIVDFNKVIGVLTPVLFIFGAIAFLFIRQRLPARLKSFLRTGEDDWKVCGDRCVQPVFGINPRVLLVFRFLVFAQAFYFVMDTLIRRPRVVQAFTIWNWFFLTLYFGIGTFLSVQYERHGPSGKDMTKLERFFWIMMEIGLPSTILICLVVWLILYPSVLANGVSEDVLVNPFSILSHGVNVIFFFVDFLLNGLYVVRFHFAYVVMWGAAYLTFHNIFMLIRDSMDLDHCPIYGFLTFSSPLLIVWMIGLVTVYYIFFTLGECASHFKRKYDCGDAPPSTQLSGGSVQDEKI